MSRRMSALRLGLESRRSASAAQTASTRGRHAAGRLADDQPLAEAVPHHAGRRAAAGEVHDAAEHAARAAARRRCGRRDRRWRAARSGSAAAACRNHHGTPFIAGSTTCVGPISGASARRHGGQRRRLDGDHHQIVRGRALRVVARRDARARCRCPLDVAGPVRARARAASVAPRASADTVVAGARQRAPRSARRRRRGRPLRSSCVDPPSRPVAGRSQACKPRDPTCDRQAHLGARDPWQNSAIPNIARTASRRTVLQNRTIVRFLQLHRHRTTARRCRRLPTEPRPRRCKRASRRAPRFSTPRWRWPRTWASRACRSARWPRSRR